MTYQNALPIFFLNRGSLRHPQTYFAILPLSLSAIVVANWKLQILWLLFPSLLIRDDFRVAGHESSHLKLSALRLSYTVCISRDLFSDDGRNLGDMKGFSA